MGKSGRQEDISTIGWREWVALPTLGIPSVKAKIDTGARSSAIHAFDIHIIEPSADAECRQPKVRFKIHPRQHDTSYEIVAEAVLIDRRIVRSSVGHEQLRPVITTQVQVGSLIWPIELTLTNRDVMGFRMLLGRQAVRDRFLVDPGRSYLQSSPSTRQPNHC